jgi:DNA-binding transcriptional LysR family regulator
MELRQLEYFVAVVEEANFTRAAARVHVAQPGVSAQIRRLERELGEELLDRSGRSVRLTSAGTAVLPYARAALNAAAGARLAIDELTGLIRGNVRVGMVVACGALELPDLLADFHFEHPAVEIALIEANSDQLLDGLLAGRLDLAFIGLGSATPAGIDTQVIVDERLIGAVSTQHALAGKKTITLAALEHETLISLPKGTGLRAVLEEACAASGSQPKIGFEASHPVVLAQLAARGLGVAILPESTVRVRSAELHAISIIRPELRGRVALAWNAQGSLSPAARTLLRRARRVLPALSSARAAV